MSERTYYVICEDNCKFESMTKEQIISAIAEATGNTPTSIDSAFITKIKETNANANLKFWRGTTAQFNALATKDGNTFYILTDDNTNEVISNISHDIDVLQSNAAIKENADGALEYSGKTVPTRELVWNNPNGVSIVSPDSYVEITRVDENNLNLDTDGSRRFEFVLDTGETIKLAWNGESASHTVFTNIIKNSTDLALIRDGFYVEKAEENHEIVFSAREFAVMLDNTLMQFTTEAMQKAVTAIYFIIE